MKKFVMMAVMMLMTMAASAQDGKMAAGVNVNYATMDGYSPLGLGAKFQYEFIENVRGEASFNYFFPKDMGGIDSNMWDLNLNFHYLVPLGEQVKFYPLAGLAYQTAVASASGHSESDSKIGFNAGVGAEYFVSSNIKLNVEAKYQYVSDDRDWPVFSVGFAYVF